MSNDTNIHNWLKVREYVEQIYKDFHTYIYEYSGLTFFLIKDSKEEFSIFNTSPQEIQDRFTNQHIMFKELYKMERSLRAINEQISLNK
jgi:hypothetical protein